MRGLSDLIDSDMENSKDIVDSILSSSSDGTTAVTKGAKKPKKRHRVTMPKPKSRVAKTSPAPKKAATRKPTAAKRKALEEQVNEAEPMEEVKETQPAKPRAKAPTKAKAHKAPRDVVEEGMEVDQSPAAATSHFAPSRSTKTAPRVVPAESTARTVKKPKPAPRPAVQETQPGVDATESEAEDRQIVGPLKQRNISRQNSRVRPEPAFRRRAGSASDTERGDPNLRRKLGDITRKFENVDLKYRNLKEVGINEANANVEKLRKQCEATTQASNDLITSLKQELAVQGPLAQDARKFKKQIQTHETEMSKLRTTATELTTSLTAAQNEIKALQAKLAAARASSVVVESRTPARDAKKEVRPAPLPVSEAVQIAQMKEELYSDLTGLIIRSVKRSEDGDTYDCIQTGRNGSKSTKPILIPELTLLALHFKLFVDAEEAKNASFEETDFLYTPLLDANRDRDMIELMPTYLTEEITFARQNAAKFYGRVLDTLTKRRVEE